MKVYAGMDPRLTLPAVIAHAQRVEALGYDGLHVAETVHDSLAVALLVAEHTSRITVRTSVTLAFTRSPTLTAYAAWDLSKFSEGRFQLGLGTQIRQNIEDRYAMVFSHDPVGQLRDYVGAVRAVWAAFVSGEPPSFESTHYRVTRMQPYFNPGPDDTTVVPPLYLGGVQRRACALAGEVADGFVTHPTNSNPLYLETTCRPGLAEGAQRAGRDLVEADFELVIGTQVITGSSPEAVQTERERQRRLLAFLYSTPAYAPTLELYGWGDLGPELRALVRHDRWDDLSTLLSDEVLDTLVPSGTFEELPDLLWQRFGDLGRGIVASPPADRADDGAFGEVIAALQAGSG
jgi:probable F420-dependent oxidoreductase